MHFFAALLLTSAFVATFASDFDREVDVHWEIYKVFYDYHWKWSFLWICVVSSVKSHVPKPHHQIEEGARKENFKKSHKIIDEHNKGGNNFTMEHNHISDMVSRVKDPNKLL